MLIRTRIQFAIVLAVVIVSVTSVFIGVSVRNFNRHFENEKESAAIIQLLSELSQATYDISVMPTDKSMRKWSFLYQGLIQYADGLTEMSTPNSIDPQIVNEQLANIKTVYDQLAYISVEQTNIDLSARALSSQLLVQVQDVSAKILEMLLDETIHARAVEKRVNSGVAATVFGGMLVLIFLLVLVKRHVVSPILQLKSFIDKAQQPPNSPSQVYQGQDEIGELFKTFEQFSNELHEQNLVLVKTNKILHESELHQRAVITAMADALVTIDEAGFIQSFNPAAEQMFGYSEIEVLGKNVAILMPDPYREEHDDYISRYLQTRVPRILNVKRELIAQRKSGVTFPIELAVREIRFEDKCIFSGMVRDITEQKRYQDLLKRNAEVLEELSEITTSAAAFTEKIEELLKFGLQAFHLDLAIVSKIEDECYIIIAASAQSVEPPATGTVFEFSHTYCSHVYQADGPVALEHVAQSELRDHPCYRKFNLEAYIGTPIIIDKKRFGTLNFSSARPRMEKFSENDFTLIKLMSQWIASTLASEQARAEIRARERALMRSNEELEKFAYVASHDLQEPLRKVNAFGERLKTHCCGHLDDKARDYIDRMQSASQRMSILINDLLTFSRISSRGGEFTVTNLHSVLQGVLSDLELTINDKHAVIHVEQLPTIEADATQMRQLIQNLLSNALKFQKPDAIPEITISAEVLENGRDSEDKTTVMVKMNIQDNGIGFDAKYESRIFEVFQRLHSRQEYEGTGIGLAICRKIAERHGGYIKTHSSLGKGALFEVFLRVSHK